MPIDSTSVGGAERQNIIIGDPVTAANKAAVVSVGDALNTSGKFAALFEALLGLVNPISGNKDLARAAPGTTGVQSVSPEGTKATFSAATNGINLAATATDFFTIFGSGTKTVRVLRITVSANATANASADMLLIVRSTADTGGTSSTPTSVPHDSNNIAPTATLAAYSVNPTLGTAVGNLRARKINFGAAGSAGTIEWKFSDVNDQGIVLRGTAQGLCLNFAGQAVPSGDSIDVEVEWVEDNS